MPTAEDIYHARKKVFEWYVKHLIKKGHEKHSATELANRTAYEEQLESFKKSHPLIWTGPYSPY